MASGSREVEGVGGWLAGLLVCLFIACAAMMLNIYRQFSTDPAVAAFYGERWPVLQTAFVSLSAIGVIGTMVVIWRLLDGRTWRSVQIALVGLWAVFCLLPLMSAMTAWLIAEVPFPTMIQSLAPSWSLLTAFAALWSAYLLRSRRVANTYRKPSPPN